MIPVGSTKWLGDYFIDNSQFDKILARESQCFGGLVRVLELFQRIPHSLQG
jgi:hypothetical protein